MPRRCVLLVEDEVLIRLAIAEELRDRGFLVVEASNADEAWAFLSTGTVDLVFTDIQMPGSMDGLELARRVRQSHPATPVVVTSGQVVDEASQGQGRFVPKPYHVESVAGMLHALLEEENT